MILSFVISLRSDLLGIFMTITKIKKILFKDIAIFTKIRITNNLKLLS